MTILDSAAAAATTGSATHELADALAQRAPVPGRHATAWPGLGIMREDHPQARIPGVLEPCVFFVAQGRKRAYLGSEAFNYDPLHYLVVSVPLPIESQVVEASPGQPYLALGLRLQAAAISELLLETGETGRRGNGVPPRGLYVSPLSETLSSAVLRLVTALDDPIDRRVLAPMAEREILYHLLVGEQGERLRAVALRDSQTQRIARVLHFLQTHYDQPLDIASIADVAHMSPSTLHHTFRAVTNSSPLQYLKKIRLHQARLLMLSDGLGAGEAARWLRQRFAVQPRVPPPLRHPTKPRRRDLARGGTSGPRTLSGARAQGDSSVGRHAWEITWPRASDLVVVSYPGAMPTSPGVQATRGMGGGPAVSAPWFCRARPPSPGWRDRSAG